MADLSFYVGILGNVVSILVFCSPVSTFLRVVRKKSTESFKGIPYVTTLLSTLTWTYYGLLNPNGLLVVTVNGTGTEDVEGTDAEHGALWHSGGRHILYTAREAPCDGHWSAVRVLKRWHVRFAHGSNEDSGEDEECEVHAIPPLLFLVPQWRDMVRVFISRWGLLHCRAECDRLLVGLHPTCPLRRLLQGGGVPTHGRNGDG